MCVCVMVLVDDIENVRNVFHVLLDKISFQDVLQFQNFQHKYHRIKLLRIYFAFFLPFFILFFFSRFHLDCGLFIFDIIPRSFFTIAIVDERIFI